MNKTEGRPAIPLVLLYTIIWLPTNSSSSIMWGTSFADLAKQAAELQEQAAKKAAEFQEQAASVVVSSSLFKMFARNSALWGMEMDYQYYYCLFCKRSFVTV